MHREKRRSKKAPTMRFETTHSNGLIVDTPHRILATADVSQCYLGFEREEFVEDVTVKHVDDDDQAQQSEVSRAIAKTVLGRWFADTMLS